MFRKYIYSVIIIGISYIALQAQNFHAPFDFPLYLSGNFGELRPNHFHSGLDFKTQGVEGKPVLAVKNGYICRVVVSPWGYGNVVYISHPEDSIKTVYAHLQRFTREVAEYVKIKQYEQESYSVDLSFSQEEFPVSAGQIIGYSGNSGSSGGPHLHFEIRDLITDDPFDPLPYYKERIKDTRPPKAKDIMVYPIEGEGIVNNASRKQKIRVATTKEGKQAAVDKIEAWGIIAFSINVDDYMDGTQNVYGVKTLKLLVDSQEIFRSNLDRFSLSETRYLNAWVDYELWRNNRSYYTKTFVEPGNKLRFITSKNRGYLHIREPRPYSIIFHLEDAYGNINRIPLTILGKEQKIPPLKEDTTTLFYWNGENRFGAKGIRLNIPRGRLYNDLHFRYKYEENENFISGIYRLHDVPVPLHQKAQLSLYIQEDTLSNPSQYGIVSIRKNKRSWIGGNYRDGWIDADISELGNSYAISIDSIPPKIIPIESGSWLQNKKISFKITDNLSGVKTFRGEINGEYVLFEMDGEKALIWYTFDSERLKRGNNQLSLTVTDACGNVSVYKYSFNW